MRISNTTPGAGAQDHAANSFQAALTKAARRRLGLILGLPSGEIFVANSVELRGDALSARAALYTAAFTATSFSSIGSEPERATLLNKIPIVVQLDQIAWFAPLGEEGAP